LLTINIITGQINIKRLEEIVRLLDTFYQVNRTRSDDMIELKEF